MTAPIGHTCPDIDTAKKRLADIVGYAADELAPQTLRHVNREADVLDDDLENLRTSNETLRSWGESVEGERDDLQEQLDELTEEHAAIKDKLEESEEHVAQLEDLCQDIAALIGRRDLTRRQRLAAACRLVSEAGYRAPSDTLPIMCEGAPNTRPALPARRM